MKKYIERMKAVRREIDSLLAHADEHEQLQAELDQLSLLADEIVMKMESLS